MTLDPHKRLRRRPEPIYVFAMLFSCGVAALAVALSLRVEAASAAPKKSSASLAQPGLPAVKTAGERQTDLAAGLPAAFDARQFIQGLRTSSSASGVSVAAVSTWTVPAAADSVGRLGLSIDFSGSYSQIRAVIAQALGRTPGLVLSSLSVKRPGPPIDLDAHAEFLLQTRPDTLPSRKADGLLSTHAEGAPAGLSTRVL